MKKIKPEILIILAVVVLVATMLGASAYHAHFKQQQNQSKTETTKQLKAKKAKLDRLSLPQLQSKVAKNETEVVLQTTAGAITLKLFNQQAPHAVENFVTHAKAGYYDGTNFHRVLKDFMIQGGDPKNNGQGGHSIWYKKNAKIDDGNGFANEISDQLYNLRGALSMANAGPDTNGSQFFINQNHDNQTKKINQLRYPQKIYQAYRHGGNPDLDGQYTVFGQVIKGMDVVDDIANQQVTDSDNAEKSKPVHPVKIKTIKIVKMAQ